MRSRMNPAVSLPSPCARSCCQRRWRRAGAGRRRTARRRAAADDQPADHPEGHAARAGHRRRCRRSPQSLGVQCNYCHVQEGRGGRNDMASDEKPTKKAARGMMLLAREINAKLPEAVGKPADATTRVGCATCHRGVPIPKQMTDIVDRRGGERRRGRRHRQVQGAAREVLRRPELRLQRERPAAGRAARQRRTSPTMRWRTQAGNGAGDCRRGIDLEAEDRAGLRAVGVFNAGVLRGGIHPDAVHSQRLPVGADIEHRKVERVRAVEIHGLRGGAGRRIAVANEIVQTGIADRDRRARRRQPAGSGEAVRILLCHCERVVGDQIRPRGASGPATIENT